MMMYFEKTGGTVSPHPSYFHHGLLEERNDTANEIILALLALAYFLSVFPAI